MRYIFCLTLLLVTFSVFSQVTEIKVVSKADGKSIPFTIISTESLASRKIMHYYCDDKGIVFINISDTTLIIAQSIGFIKDSVILFPGIKNYNFYLESSDFALDEIVVTGQHKPTSVDKSIYNIKLIGVQQIEKKAATNLVSLLNNELAISLNHDPSTGTSMKLQGISGENVKILIDGIPVIGRLDGNIDLSQIDLSNVDHIEIVEGPMSVVYGSNALAGVVNIITKDGMNEKIRNTISAFYESVGTYNLNNDLMIRNGDYNLGLSFGRNFFGGFDVDPSDRSMQYKPKEQYNVALKNQINIKNGSLKLQNAFFIENLLDRSNIILTPYSATGFDTWYKTTRSTNTMDYKKVINKNSNLNFIVDYSFYKRTRLKYVKDMTDLSTSLAQGENDHDTSRVEAYFSRGIFAKQFGILNNSFQIGYDLNVEISKGKRFLNQIENIQDYALFTDLQWNITNSLVLQPGIRIAYNNRFKSPLIPAINLKYNYKNIATRISYARGFRAPSLKELYINFIDSNHQIEGNQNLQAENSHNYNLSIDWKNNLKGNRKLNFETKLFYNYIFNMIDLVQVDPNNELNYKNENIGNFKSKGLELTTNFINKANFNIKTGFAYIGKTDFYDENSFIFFNNFNLEFTYNFITSGTSFSTFYKHYGKLPYYTYYDRLQLNYLEGYNNLDITFSQKLLKDRLKLIFGAKNIFNVIEIAGFADGGGTHGTGDAISSLAGWGRTYFLNLKYTFSVNN